jgi:hypothetical protein
VYIIMTRTDVIDEADFYAMINWSEERLWKVHSRATWRQIVELAQILDLPERPPASSKDWRVSPNIKKSIIFHGLVLVLVVTICFLAHSPAHLVFLAHSPAHLV